MDDLYFIGHESKTLDRFDITNFVGELFKKKMLKVLKSLLTSFISMIKPGFKSVF